MLTGIDHLVIAVADPDAAAAQLEASLGISVGPGGRHERRGTRNRLAWFGDTYVELIGVVDRALAAGSWIGAPTLRALDAGGGLVTWAIGTDALAADGARLRADGADLGEPIAGERQRPDGRMVRWRLAGPPSLSVTAPFLIEHDQGGAEWTDGERAERASARHPAGGPIRLEVLEVPVADVNRAMQRLLRGAGLRFRPSLAGGGARDANLGGQLVRLRPAPRGDASTATIRLVGPALPEQSADLLGCRWLLRPIPSLPA
jgi:hypothetical protein